MLSHPVRSAVAGTLVIAGVLGGTAGIAQADTLPATPGKPVLCATVDALQGALYDLSHATDPALIDVELGAVIVLLQEYPPVLPSALEPTYDWLVSRFQILRNMIATMPRPELIQLLNDLTANLANALENVPCAPENASQS
ncbi:hypothetical protein [Amycolatopsis sp. GM8]|uniref:hypothetical protein n=1 Tax=Amycolatopsis sp. GM8 TaxID=2896530 RepID=UPI001F2D4D15|nr:hypothetical protein [Amycolatopsis sp. GM8]